MSRPSQEKCRLCSKLSSQDAQLRHGPKGSSCWDATHCHQRRSYYRYRSSYNSNRRQSRRAQEDNIEVVPVPAVPAAVLYLYRQRVDAPIHAVGAELWLGQEKKAAITRSALLRLNSRSNCYLFATVTPGFFPEVW